jgi:hypothetical protein
LHVATFEDDVEAQEVNVEVAYAVDVCRAQMNVSETNAGIDGSAAAVLGTSGCWILNGSVPSDPWWSCLVRVAETVRAKSADISGCGRGARPAR